MDMAMCIRETGKHIGNIYLRQINWISRNAELRIFIGDPDERSKGYGKSAIRQLLEYAFKDMGLKKIHLGVLTDNPAALKSYERIGFKVEGKLLRHVFKQGQWKDVILLGIFAEDFPPAETC
jgi:RimJ/RimL family protein N-acetyltransferase